MVSVWWQTLLIPHCDLAKDNYCHKLLFLRYETNSEVLAQICPRINSRVWKSFKLVLVQIAYTFPPNRHGCNSNGHQHVALQQNILFRHNLLASSIFLEILLSDYQGYGNKKVVSIGSSLVGSLLVLKGEHDYLKLLQN